ncbi:hypothetical protein GUITHDRAFT_155105 [Guillardia theta CCMP2712]|uniref:Uncharacterized protein n=2 Tax=Guillardia theta TaxID=55529 RepID=L1ILB4_GUITC|nr:hypothetical protein GUITHDRAFT_155105 [Guillardia theta CCMP2712]EKX36907.1 hypothetical protein GUITHDRAFT_155105 [Guillardia theta CCMP2712]|mmetsp:Transcript_36348/g.113333  ORF Transcript_36348/g.113333 Transcript_36348/m.113333 type:complete len:144 (+) Transcript_36348:211-642(+)|eukprot:XP_005823887.1 hypothetical protein GUITHDRAFT_155105 [Guillardia theta CCMP2712]
MNRAARIASPMLKSLRVLSSRAFSSHAPSLDAILGGDLSMGPISQRPAAIPAVHVEEKPTDNVLESAFLHCDALEQAQMKDRAYVLSMAESLLGQASANWSLEFTTLKFEEQQANAHQVVSYQERRHWDLALQLACGPSCMRH